ncbi:DNA-directed RNA polymerases I, II, and III subunit RPABC3 [Mycena sanguinolenta]|uniref:DNA-directed RNA polymerases I, II, and III subunit RPABC3 n=1 Tax=Mycena sanguinolenta TaxID=230812 RepID=A0A8H7CKQ5_9AGAR|nr:DNA-directed RNA polymerases I, II, and III subunit RPABC3 [Mycena sanguinolenta]
MAAAILAFDDIFTINAIDKEGRKFDRVSRLYAQSKNYDMRLTLDYNIELFPLVNGQSFALALASSPCSRRANSRFRD